MSATTGQIVYDTLNYWLFWVWRVKGCWVEKSEWRVKVGQCDRCVALGRNGRFVIVVIHRLYLMFGCRTKAELRSDCDAIG